MKIKDLLSPRAIRLNAPAESKSQAIDALVELHAAAGNLTDPSAYKAAILAREKQGTTAIGEGIAVPHAKSDSVAHAALAAMTVPGGVDYDAPDGKPSSLLFMIAAPPDGDVHLEILSRLMVMLMEPEFCDRLRGAKTAALVYDSIAQPLPVVNYFLIFVDSPWPSAIIKGYYGVLSRVQAKGRL